MNEQLKLQVGTIFEFTEENAFDSVLGGNELNVPAGAKAFVTRLGFAHLISPSKVNGKILKLDNAFTITQGVNIEHIAFEITRRLARDFEWDNDEKQEALDTIRDVLDIVF
jgi:hypothetical protein